MKILQRIFAFLSSYGLSIVLLLLMMVLVFFGTLEQTRLGLFETQRRYFESLVVVHPVFGWFPLPLPGGYLLLALVFVNMLFGAIVRAPKRWRRPGLLIAHGGVLYLIVAGFVAYTYAINGNLPLYEGDSGSRFQSYYEWEIRIYEMAPDSEGRVFIIPQDEFEDVGDTGRVFYHQALPLELRVVRYYPNCRPAPSRDAWSVDGVTLSPLPKDSTAEQNVPGVFVSLHQPGQEAAPSEPGILWGMERGPWRMLAEGREYAFALRRREWELPFTLTLEQFNHETHPGTTMPSHFSSEIVLQEGDAKRDVLIRMNEPLRHRGYTFYQASWGPTDAQPGDPLYSVLAVTRNPAGQWPMYASFIISFGLLLHFGQALLRYLRQQSGVPSDAHKR